MIWNPWKHIAELESSLRLMTAARDQWAKRGCEAETESTAFYKALVAAESELEQIAFQRLDALKKANAVNAAKRERNRIVGDMTGAVTHEGGL